MLQWFWFGTAADQTYESCVDMVVPGSSSAAVNATVANSTSVARSRVWRGNSAAE